MNVIVLAAGMGNRLGDATRNLPKALVTVAGKPLLHYVMDFLKHPAVQEITVIGGYQFDQVQAYLKKNYPKVKCVQNPDYMRGSILTIRTALPFLTTHTLIMNTDHIYPKRLMNKLLSQCRGITAVCDTDRNLVEDDMKVLRNPQGLVTDIDKRLTQCDAGYIGMTFCALDQIPTYKAAVQTALDTRGDEVAVEAALRWLAQNGKPIHVADVSGMGWLEVDTAEDRAAAEEKLKSIPGFLA
jgi:choline kinase